MFMERIAPPPIEGRPVIHDENVADADERALGRLAQRAVPATSQ